MEASRIAAEASKLLPLAHQVLDSYAFDVKDVEHLATHSNVLYRVVTTAGEQLVLRMGSPDGNPRENIEFEVRWLDAIQRDTDLNVVAPMHADDGSMIVEAVEDGGRSRPCVVFSWIPGVPLADGAGTFGYRKLGEMSAALQRHGKQWSPPDMGRMRRWDRVFYYEPEAEPIIMNQPNYDHLFGRQRLKVINRAGEAATRVIEESWSSSEAQVVHGDLHEWNVHLAQGRLYAFDFEDVMLALPAQDVAVSLYSSRSGEHRHQARKAFRSGYESVATWPVEDESQLDGFHAARQIMLMNHAARSLPVREAAAYLDQVMPWLEGYVQRYG